MIQTQREQYFDKNVVFLRFVNNALSTCHARKSCRDVARLVRSDICHCASAIASWSLHSSYDRRILARRPQSLPLSATKTTIRSPLAPRTQNGRVNGIRI